MHPSSPNTPTHSSQIPNKEEDLAKHCTKLGENVTFNQKFQFVKVKTTLMIDHCGRADKVLDEVIELTIEDAIEKANEHEVKVKYLGIRFSAFRPGLEFGTPIQEVTPHTIQVAVNKFILLCYSKPSFYGKPFSITVTIVGDVGSNM
jgi:hypothetical protein